MSRVELSRIQALTFYKDSETLARRTSPIPQLSCSGKACELYTPEVVRCENIGSTGRAEVDWKCEADLPETLRFGRVEVSCEGWSGPGDPYILKGSCGLQYRLVQIPDSLHKPSSHTSLPFDTSGIIFTIVWVAFLVFILWGLLKSCLRDNPNPLAGSTRPPNYRPGGGGGGGGGWFPGGNDPDDAPPPYYAKPSGPSTSTSGSSGWPTFLTGAVLGGLGTQYFNNRRQQPPPPPPTRPWDWERRTQPQPSASTSFFSRRSTASNEDRGEGPSSLGAMRRSTGLGGTTVR